MNPTVAAFDFDGTITYRDSLLPFLFFTHGTLRTLFMLTSQLPWLVGFVIGFVPRQRAKERIIKKFFAGKTLAQVQEWGKQFARDGLPQHVRPEALKRIRWHRDRGDRLVLISASLDIYLRPWAESEDFSELICSSLETDSQGIITGKLCGLNCWGPEKVRRLLETAGPKKNYTLYAYGDSRGDQELLALADHSFYKTMGE
ncbi:MAG: HAD family hydrolase [Chlamydiales bacterium]|nr:HAD family hydrolase [Chlamydiia bacterium]MCP5508056.1 HAD family hydrolase [Chlamydiales bacterium]